MYNPGNLENNGANQDDIQKRNSENFVGPNMSLTNNANSPQSESASKTSTTAALRRWRRPEAQDTNSKNVSTRGTSNDTENSVKIPSSTVNQSKEMNSLNNNNNSNSYANNTHIDNLNGSASQNDYSMFVSPASLSPIVPQSTARPYDTNAYIPRVPPETGAYSRTSPVVTTPNKLTPEIKSSDTAVRHPISGNIQSPYYPHDNTAQQHYRSTTGYPIQNTPPLTPTSTQSPIYGVPNQKRDYGYQNYTSKSPQEQRITREHSVLTHSYSAGSGINLDASRVQGIGDDSKMNGYRQGYHLQNSAERRVTPPKPKSPIYRNFPNASAMMDSRILAQNYVTTSGRVQAAEYMAQNYYLNKSSCIVQEARVQNQIHSGENPVLDGKYQQSYNSYIMPKSTVINSQDPKLYRNIITSSKKHAAPFPILEQRLNTAESYSPEYLAQNNSQAKYGQVIMPRSSPTSRITRDSSNIPMHSNYIPQSSNQKCPQDMMIPSNYALHNKYFPQNTSQDWRLIKDYESNAHLNQMNQMHTRLPHSTTNRTPEVPRDIPFMEQNQRIIQKPRMFYPEPGSVEYLQYAAKNNIPVAQKSPKVISYNVSDQIQNDYLNLTRTSSNAVRPNEYSRNPVIQAPNAPEGPYIVHQAYRSEIPNEQHNYQMVQNSRHPSYAINYSNRQVKEIPPRNISPRRTFQENMPYFVISPPHAGLSNTSPPSLYNSEHSQHNYPGYYSRDPNYPGVTGKPTIPQYPVDSTKYQNVPFGRNISQQRHPYGYQEQYFQRNMDPNQFAGSIYRQHNPNIAEQAAQARAYAEEYRNQDSINSNYNEFERNRRKEEIGKSLKEFLESWEDDEDIVSNLPDLVLNIPTDRQKNNSVSSLESGENNETGKTMPTNEMHKDIQGNPQAEPLYVLDARSISSDALSQYLPYCKVYQSLPENIRGFYPNSVPSKDTSVLSQQVASEEASDTQPENEELETNIIDSPSPHDLSVNRKTDEEDNVQAEVLNLSTNRNKENDEFMTEEYSNASDDTSLPENVSSPLKNGIIHAKEDAKQVCEVIKSPSATLQNKTIDDTPTNSKEELSLVNNTKNTQISVENESKQELLETTIEKPVTASVIVQNTFLPNKPDNSSGKSKENQPEKPLEEINNETSKNDFNDSSENITSPKSKNLENKRSSVDSLESADSIRTSLIESEIKDIDFNKDNLDDDQFDFDTALLSTETKDSNEDVLPDSKTDEDANKNSLIRDNGIDLSLETMLLSPEPINTSFEDCIPEVTNSPKADSISVSTSNNEDKSVFDKSSIENVEEINLPKSIQITTDLNSLEMAVDKPNTEVTDECNIKESNNSEKITDDVLVDTEEHSDNLELCLDSKLNSAMSDQQTENCSRLESTAEDINKESESKIEENILQEDTLEKIDDSKIEISEKQMDLSTMDDENSDCEPHFDNTTKSSFSIADILKQTEKSTKVQEETIQIEAVNMDDGGSKLSESIEHINEDTPINEDHVNNEAEVHAVKSNENTLENTEDTIEISKDESFEEHNKYDTSSISGDKSNMIEIENDEISQKSVEDVELSEAKINTPSEHTENNPSSISKIETSIENDIKADLIENKEITEEILTDLNENTASKNENSISTTVQESSKIETESFEDLIDMPTDEKIDITRDDTNEKLNAAEVIEEVPLINEENTCYEKEQFQENLSDNNLIESNISLINSPSVSIQEEITIPEEITDEIIKENKMDEIEVGTENKPDTEAIYIENEDNIPNIKYESNVFDEDTMSGFEDLEKDIDKKIKIIGETNTDYTIEEFKIETKLNSTTTSNMSDLPSEELNDCLKKDLNETMQTVIDHTSSDAEEYQHLIKLEDEETLDNTDLEKYNGAINKENDKTPVDATKIENELISDSKEISELVINNSLSNVLPCKEEKETLVDSPKNIQNVLPINLQYSEEKSIPEEDTIIEEVLENKKTDLTAKVNVLFNEEILVEHILTNENITLVENDSNEITEKIEENIIVSEDPSCLVVYSDDENIVILQSDPNELVNPENEETPCITTEETNDEDIKEDVVVVNLEKEEFIPQKIIEEDIIGNEVIICENGIEDDWIQNEEIVETKIEDQVKKEDEKSKVEEIEKKRLLMEKRREKKKRLEKLRKRKLLSAIKATNTFLEEERKACIITETINIKNSNTSSPFKEKITDDKELFINPENPSSSSEDNTSMTHELLNLKPRIKRRFSFVDSLSPKIDFVAPKRRYSNMEYVRNIFKKPIINLDEISNNITKVIENLNKQENLQYQHSVENSKPINKVQDVSKVIECKKPVISESKNINPISRKENETHFGRFEIRKVIDTDDFFVKPAENLVKPFIKPIINLNNLEEDKNILLGEIQENQIENKNEIVKINNLNDANKSDSTKLKEPKNENINVKEKIISNEDKFHLETNVLQPDKPSLKTNSDTATNSKCENLPSFQNYTEDLRKKINADVTNNKLLLQAPAVVLKPLPVFKITEPEMGNKMPLQNTLIIPNKQRNIDPRIDRPKETPKPDVSSILIKNKTPKTFGLTEYTKNYLKMKTGQTINPQIHFGQNGVKRLDPRLTVKPEKPTENVESAIVSTRHKIDINTKSKSNQEKKVKINLQDYRNRKLSESEKQTTSPKELDDTNQETTDSSVKSDPSNGLSNSEPCRFYIRDKSEKLLDNKTVEKIVIKPKKPLEKVSNDTFGVSKDNTNNHNLDCKNLSDDNINHTLKSNLDFKTQKPKKRKKRFRNLDASDEEDEVVTKQQNVTLENQNGIVEDPSLKINEDSQHSSSISKHNGSGSGDNICSCCVDLNSNSGTTSNNCGLKCHIKLNALQNKIRNYEINKNTSGISNLKLTLKTIKKKPKPAFAEVLSSIDSVVENEVKTTKRKPCTPGLNKCDSSGGKKSAMWTIKNKVPKVIIKRNASGYCAVFRDVSSNPIWQPKIRLKRQKYIESLVLSNQVKLSKKIPS